MDKKEACSGVKKTETIAGVDKSETGAEWGPQKCAGCGHKEDRFRYE